MTLGDLEGKGDEPKGVSYSLVIKDWNLCFGMSKMTVVDSVTQSG